MQVRKLGRTGIDVGIIGLGAEHLDTASDELIRSVVDEAVDHGASYIDLMMAKPHVRDAFGKALKGKRDKAVIAGHLGVTLVDGQYNRSRDKVLCEQYFDDLLVRLQTDHIDVLMLHYCDEIADFENIAGASGVLELAVRLKQAGKARTIGMSSHMAPVCKLAVETGHVEVLMFPVNPAFDMLAAETHIDVFFENKVYHEQEPVMGRKAFFQECERQGVAIVAMKAYAAGRLFEKDNPSSIVMTPVQCIHYALSQPGVCVALPGCKSPEEVRAALAYLDASEAEKDYAEILSATRWNLKGSCMYCNHCLPCPQGIDIAAVTALLDSAASGVSAILEAKYKALEATGGDCIQCGACMERCPFHVDVIENMERAAALFGY
ncbi:MAG: aldo/keto reductase [Anaerolineae bacterium]